MHSLDIPRIQEDRVWLLIINTTLPIKKDNKEERKQKAISGKCHCRSLQNNFEFENKYTISRKLGISVHSLVLWGRSSKWGFPSYLYLRGRLLESSSSIACHVLWKQRKNTWNFGHAPLTRKKINVQYNQVKIRPTMISKLSALISR